MQQPVGEHMPTFGVGTQLNFVHRQKINAHAIGHRLDRADPILGAVGDNPFLARHQRHYGWPTGAHNPVIDLSGQQTQRQSDDAGAVAQHPFNGVMGFSGIGRPQNGRDPGFGRHGNPRKSPCLQGLAF